MHADSWNQFKGRRLSLHGRFPALAIRKQGDKYSMVIYRLTLPP